MVVIVADALAGGVTSAGLTVQLGGSTVVWVIDVTWQPRSTVPLKPLTVPTVMFEDDVPVGGTASGDRGAACSVNWPDWANADEGKANNTANRHRAATAVCRVGRMNLDFDDLKFDDLDFDNLDFDSLDFNMSRFGFK
jgi:hypothetical protein